MRYLARGTRKGTYFKDRKEKNMLLERTKEKNALRRAEYTIVNEN
jgi:hypothetical protein